MEFPLKANHEFGDYFAVDTFIHPLYFIFDPVGIQHVLEKNHLNYKKSWTYQILKLSLGDGLLT